MGRSGRGGAAFGKKIKLLFYRAPADSRAGDALAAAQVAGGDCCVGGGKGRHHLLAGGALGFDTVAAQEVLRVRGEGYPGLKLELVLPYVGQEEQWSQRDASVYRAMLRQADQVVYIANRYTQGCMFQRNRYLVEHSAYCLCYQKQERGGTAYTVRYANSQGLAVRNLAIPPWQE